MGDSNCDIFILFALLYAHRKRALNWVMTSVGSGPVSCGSSQVRAPASTRYFSPVPFTLYCISSFIFLAFRSLQILIAYGDEKDDKDREKDFTVKAKYSLNP